MHYYLNVLLKWSLTMLTVKKKTEKNSFLILFSWRLGGKVTFLFLFFVSFFKRNCVEAEYLSTGRETSTRRIFLPIKPYFKPSSSNLVNLAGG